MGEPALSPPPGRTPAFGHGPESRARRDALRAIALDMPDPAEFAFYLGADAVQALREAYLGREGWRVPGRYVRLARDLSLAEARGPCLTAFGLAVRRAVMREDG